MMDILSWIQQNRPGRVHDFGDRVEVAHQSGEHSTLWKRQDGDYPAPLNGLLDCYKVYDGIDLFSSTFKIASILKPQQVDGVHITFTLQSLASETSAKNCMFPSGSVPFMYQAGIGYYAVQAPLGKIYEWDAETGEISDEFDSFESIINEWIDAVT